MSAHALYVSRKTVTRKARKVSKASRKSNR